MAECRSRSQRSSAARSGFTLLELLVAVTLLALMMALLTGSLRFGARVWEAGAQVDRDAKIASIQRLLFTRLNEAEAIRFPPEPGKMPEAAFQGGGEDFTFAALAGGPAGPGGYYLVRLYTEEREREDGSGMTLALMFSQRLVQPGGRPDGTERTEAEPQIDVLLEDIAGFEAAFYGRERVDDPPEWLSEWHDRADLPSLVRLRVSFPDGDRRTWPELTAPLAFAAR